MAGLLAGALPDSDRAEARSLLLERILPARLAGLSSHPNPRRLAEVVYGRVADALDAASEADRLATLRKMALRAEVGDHLNASLALGVARYLEEHPEADSRAPDWIPPEAESWRSRSIDEIRAEAQRRLQALDELAERARAEDPAAWESVRVDYLNAKINLQNVESGAFRGAAGSLYDFLREAGADVESYDVA